MLNHSAHSVTNNHDSTVSTALSALAIGGIVVAGSIMLAPHVLPSLGYGSGAMAEEAMWALHDGSGIAGRLNSEFVAAIPFIGGKLAEGGFFNAITTGIIGIGGVMLGDSIGQKENGESSIRLGKFIKYGALITSALVALPTVLTAIGSGLIFLSTLSSDVTFASSYMIPWVRDTIGTMAGPDHPMMGLLGFTAAIPHFITCGASLLPAALTLKLWRDDKKEALQEAAQNASTPANSNTTSEPISLSAQIKLDTPPQSGKACQGRLRFINMATGKPLSAEELAVVHTEKVHLFIVDKALKDYHHIHPQATNEEGVFAFSFVPAHSGEYTAWSDITTASNGVNHRLQTQLPATRSEYITPTIQQTSQQQAGGLNFKWENITPLRQRGEAMVTVTITDDQGKPVTDLEPILGAHAHLVGFGDNGQSMIHCHPLGAEPNSPQDKAGPTLQFMIHTDNEKAVQFFLQVQRERKIITVPFGQKIQSQLGMPAAPAHQHTAHAAHSR